MVRSQALQTATEIAGIKIDATDIHKWCIFDKSNVFYFMRAFVHSFSL